jgi:hypothetical protein
MPARSHKGRCVHCLRFSEDITSDHVFPDSWYPESTPATVQRWTVPCCRLCNEQFGTLESDLLVRLALCLDPEAEAAKGISENALRSLGIDAGELALKEREHRENRRLKLKAEFIRVTGGDHLPGVIPGIAQEPAPGEYVVPIPWAGLAIIAEKIARGCEYKINRRKFVEPPYAVRTRVSKPDLVEPQFLLRRKVIDFGPGCQVIRIFANEDENIVQYRILIWQSLCFYVHLDHEDYFRSEFDPQRKPLEGMSADECKGMRIPHYLRELK